MTRCLRCNGQILGDSCLQCGAGEVDAEALAAVMAEGKSQKDWTHRRKPGVSTKRRSGEMWGRKVVQE